MFQNDPSLLPTIAVGLTITATIISIGVFLLLGLCHNTGK